jgi:uncharacterized membrane protein
MGARSYDRPRDGSRRGQAAAGDEEQLAKLLGWFSIGLGLAQIAAPRAFARWIGVEDPNPAVVRAVGVREIASGVGILSQPRPVGWLWARVGGDAMDLAMLARTLASPRSEKSRVTAATAATVGVTLVDLYSSEKLSTQSDGSQGAAWEDGMHVRKAITVRRPIDEVYLFWHDCANLPRFLSHLQSVQGAGERRTLWRSRESDDLVLEWEAELVEDRVNEMIAWRSLEGGDVANALQVHFRPAPGGRGTEVEVEVQFDLPGGPIGRRLARLFGQDPSQQIESDLRRFKQLMEAGEVVLSEATVEGANLPQRPAQPPERVPQLAAAMR